MRSTPAGDVEGRCARRGGVRNRAARRYLLLPWNTALYDCWVRADEIDQLVERLGKEAACERVSGGLLITTWNGETLNKPVKLHMTARQLADQIRSNAENGIGAFDDSPVPSNDTGWKLFLVHLEEALDTREPEQVNFRLVNHGVVAM